MVCAKMEGGLAVPAAPKAVVFVTYNNKAKLKTLYVKQMLEEETDQEHGLTMRQIIERLGLMGIKAERKSVYRDIEVLQEFGCDIRTYQRNPVEYALVKRTFELQELMLMVDAGAAQPRAYHPAGQRVGDQHQDAGQRSSAKPPGTQDSRSWSNPHQERKRLRQRGRRS